MLISQIKSISSKYPNYNNYNAQNPIKNKNKSDISFCGSLSNSQLLSAGYKPVAIENNRITGREDKILVDSPQKFLALLNSPEMWNKKIALTNDIDLDGAKIKPMGNNAKPFRGEFDGNGFKISNFQILSEDSYNVGLFGKCENSKLSNIDIKNAFIKGKQQVGGLTGYAINSEIKDCFFQGYIEGEKKLGGLIGLGEHNLVETSGTTCEIRADKQDAYNEFDSNDNAFIGSGNIGGIIGSDEGSILEGTYSSSTLAGKEQVGGLIGYAEKTDIQNSCFKGNVICREKAGGLVGWAANSNISNSYSLSKKNNLIGESLNSSFSNSYYKLNDIVSTYQGTLDSGLWHLEQGKLPRLKFQEEKMSAKEVFLEDINTDIKTGKIKSQFGIDGIAKGEIKIDLAPPRHYQENDAKLKAIKDCTDPNKLHEEFGKTVLNIKENKLSCDSESKYDELLLAYVQNPNLDLNRRFSSGYNVWCTPLFILTCLNKAYALQQALKREDVNPAIGSGSDGNRTAFNQSVEHNIDTCAYVFFKEPKMRKYIEPKLNKLKADNSSKFTKLLIECYPNIPDYNTEKGCLTFSKQLDVPKELSEPLKEVLELKDVQKTIDIGANYKDSRGNNIINVVASLDNEEEALELFFGAKKIGTDINHWNKKYESSIGHSLYRKKPHLLAQIMKETNTPFVRVEDGTDAMILFSSFPYKNDDLPLFATPISQNHSINYMEIAKKRGLSLNSQDNYGTTPLINAIKLGHYDKMKYLLTNGADPNLFDSAKQSPLHHACMNNDEIAINLLLDVYAYPNVKDEIGLTPVEYLEGELKEKTLKKMNEQGYLYELSGYSDYYENDYSINNLDEYNQINSKDEFNNIANELLNDNCDKTVLGLTKNILLNPNIKSMNDDEGNSVLHLAALAKSRYAKESINVALGQGFNIDEQNTNKETPLMRALDAYLCAGDIKEKVILLQNIKILFDSEPNVDLTDRSKQSALHRVCQSGNLILLNEILKLNPKINQIDINGQTPFDYIPSESDNPMRIIVEEYLKKHNVIKEKR